MNNLVEIIYKTNGTHPIVKINGEALSNLSDLSHYIYDDIFRWANTFFEIVDGNMGENYRVSLIGHPYQAVILRAAAKKSEYCEGVYFHDYEGAIPLSEKYEFAYRLKNQLGAEKADLTFCTNNPGLFASYASEQVVLSSNATSQYCIADSMEAAESLAGKYCIVLAEQNEVVSKRGTYFFLVQENVLSLAIDYFLNYHLRLPLIGEVLNNVGKYTMDAETALEFEAYTKESYRVWIEAIPNQLDEGMSIPLNMKVFPRCFPANGVTVTSNNQNVIAYQNGNLVAKKQGEATIKITDTNGHEFFSQTITVTHHNYATNITVILPSTTLLIGSTMHFRTIITPINAEDIDQITYTVSDEHVAVLTSSEDLYALSAGRICLTIATPRVSTKVYITVPEQACDVKLSTEGELKLPFSAEATIFGSAFPPNAVPLPDLEWSIEKGGNVISIEQSDNQKCVIRSNESGQAILVCKLKDTTILKKVTIVVPKTQGCYIATSVYGSYDCPEVWTLRRYRDEYLDKHLFGKLFIKCYYAISPTIVKLFGKTNFFNTFWHHLLNKKVKKLQEKGYESTPYTDKEY